MAKINSRLQWNDTQFDVVEGHTYHYVAAGYSEPKLDLLSFLKRCRAALWFQLVVAVDQNPSHTLPLLCHGHFIAPAGGRLWAYANDAALAYWNNTGFLTLTIH
jgi:hypothetical protein